MLPMPHFDLSVIALCHSFAIAKEATEQALFNTGRPIQFPGSPYAKDICKDMAFPTDYVGTAVTQEGK